MSKSTDNQPGRTDAWTIGIVLDGVRQDCFHDPAGPRDAGDVDPRLCLDSVGLLLLVAGVHPILRRALRAGGLRPDRRRVDDVSLQHRPLPRLVHTAGVFIVVPVLGRFMFVVWPRTAVGRRLQLQGPEADATVASMPVNVELEQLRGKTGRALSALRPAGVVDFEGKRIDTMTEGMMIEAGEWVRCIDVRAGRVIVRQIPQPNVDALENMELD